MTRHPRILLAGAVAVAAVITSAADGFQPAPAEAAVDYSVHDVTAPSTWNGMKVYISPGHTASNPNPFPCGVDSTSEYVEAWHIGYSLRDHLVNHGYYVMMPKRTSEVSYVTRLDTANNWWSDHTNKRFAYVTLHSNAHGSFAGCSHSGTNQHGGTQLLFQTTAQQQVGDQPFRRIARLSPGSAHENTVGNFCSIRSITELCSTVARGLPIAYMENDFHDTQAGADFLTHHHRVPYNDIALELMYGLHCYFGYGGCI